MIYVLQAMRRDDKKPTTLIAKSGIWEYIFPIKDYETDELTIYNTYSIINPPLIRYHHNFLFWIERTDQPAWRAIEK